ncbi:MAG: hypothetical protein FGM44_06050 [Limnohabitans sp.]|jgi:hypothetical protein|nr:hypothetical protein [Limnohabitans sp.]
MFRQRLIEGLTDAVGFVVGSLLGFGLGRLVGLELFAEGYSAGSLVAIALVGLGGGMGLQAARFLRGRTSPPGDPS